MAVDTVEEVTAMAEADMAEADMADMAEADTATEVAATTTVSCTSSSTSYTCSTTDEVQKIEKRHYLQATCGNAWNGNAASLFQLWRRKF